MPVITIDGPKLTKEQKSELVKSFSEKASEIMGLPVESIVTIIREVESENVGTGNILLCDRQRK
ncbi:4-oxalocrotonate tautomerase DmpI [Methanobacterium congolense]|jgi:4-oxalocrotonate tautomerase|uniref:4-oxalocrotonate tautomerase n=1 Tax=Methanobacterium congolense TaxID=118062 RepID=A0A1D3L2N1_9EURY|nr:4-oxalocrotonate tautomerase DmpI [Methanobacterium congolense]SCG85720.1 4-oxalocrotonate tautomerase [Methanobacterium congolense]